jgi:hypothetical protein
MYRRSAVDELVNPNLKNDFAHDFRFVGLGLKALPRLFCRRPTSAVKNFKLESPLSRIPFNITTFAIHSMHVLGDHRSRMRERGAEGWKCGMTIPWLFIARCWYPAFSLPFSHYRKLAYKAMTSGLFVEPFTESPTYTRLNQGG